MMLDPEQEKTVKDWHALYVKKCPLCESPEYFIEAVVGMPDIGPNGPDLTKGFTVIPIICRGCGYTILVAAAGLQFIRPLKLPTRIPGGTEHE